MIPFGVAGTERQWPWGARLVRPGPVALSFGSLIEVEPVGEAPVAPQRVRDLLSKVRVALERGRRRAEGHLASLLDARRYVESVVAGIKIPAHPDFRFCATMNDDASTFELPEYIHSRLQPQVLVDFPERDEELLILRETLPFLEGPMLEYVADFLQRAHRADEKYTVRDGINIARYASRLARLRGVAPATSLHLSGKDVRRLAKDYVW